METTGGGSLQGALTGTGPRSDVARHLRQAWTKLPFRARRGSCVQLGFWGFWGFGVPGVPGGYDQGYYEVCYWVYHRDFDGGWLQDMLEGIRVSARGCCCKACYRPGYLLQSAQGLTYGIRSFFWPTALRLQSFASDRLHPSVATPSPCKPEAHKP